MAYLVFLPSDREYTRLSIVFNTSAESWLSQQVQYDLWHAEQGRKALKVIKLAA